jgi:hypothetical protein
VPGQDNQQLLHATVHNRANQNYNPARQIEVHDNAEIKFVAMFLMEMMDNRDVHDETDIKLRYFSLRNGLHLPKVFQAYSIHHEVAWILSSALPANHRSALNHQAIVC